MVRAMNGSLVYTASEDDYQVPAKEEVMRQRVSDPYGATVEQMMAFSVSRIRDCCDQMAPFADVIDFLSFQTPDGSKPATHERRSTRQTLLEDACDAIDWFNSKEQASDGQGMTFIEACEYLGADHEIVYEVIFSHLKATYLTPAASKKLSDFLSDVVGEGEDEQYN